jgi:hypothetical protein
MDLRRLLGWAVVLLLVVLTWNRARPWLEERFHRGAAGESVALPAGSGDAARCVAAARGAADAYGEGVAAFAAQRDVEAWMRFGGDLQRRIGRAGSECSCDGEACRLAGEALGELAAAVDRADAVLRGATDDTIEPARDLERVDDLLARARDAV